MSSLPDGGRRSRSGYVAGLLVAVAAATACGQQPAQRLDTDPPVFDRVAEAPATSTPTPTADPVRPSTDRHEGAVRPGDSGVGVHNLQRRLAALGYWLGEPDGTYGHLTEQAVFALQKAAGLSPDGIVGPRTRAALREDVRPQPRRVAGSGVEVDLERQLLIYVSNGVPKLIMNASTGSGATYVQDGVDQVAVTPVGKYTVFRQVDGRDVGPLGELWRPKYFVGGVAIHGYSSVPAVPASHGCVRVSIGAMDHLWTSGMLPVGSSVWVY